MIRIVLDKDTRVARVLRKIWPRIDSRLLGNWQMEDARVRNDIDTYVMFVGFRFLENPYG
jgi:hypothetical protein